MNIVKQYKWKNRLIIVQTHSKDDCLYTKFTNDYEKSLRAIIERKMIKKSIINPKSNPKFQISIYSINGNLTHRVQTYNELNDILKLIDTDRKAELRRIVKVIKR